VSIVDVGKLLLRPQVRREQREILLSDSASRSDENGGTEEVLLCGSRGRRKV
jgi:hypothetical protein